ncbi:AzlD domain-containing protein [Jatrophihabitans telluris]|uniref:AzlD domain-containing protein n=1 Tax=Jatrophihabitans telluris TaxID=2038343 RepID=A0ABY4QVI8_9ACTN|nr:AzlD domain-containing protein [Jatrophihabitans telluris]UQX87678.1 AzlD domain-containing protein [Jatrophihabitans telluris]
MTGTSGWTIVLLSAAGCYALKLAGYAMPQRWFDHPRLRRLIELMPVALLAALIVVEAVAGGRHYDWDAARLAGVAVGAVAVWRRAPFIVVVVVAAATAALLRQL